MKKSKKLFSLMMLAGFLLISVNVYGQASLAGENVIDTIEIDGTLYTCVRDAVKEDQWYYIPNSPRLVENKIKGKMVPKFTLVRFQYKEEGKFVEGGVLQFEVNMALPPKVVGQLKKKVAKLINKNADQIRIGALPFTRAKVHLYSPVGELFTSATPTEGIAPNVATGSIPFSIKLEGSAATDIMSSLVGKGQGGIPVVVDFEYSGITPPVAGLYADVDMKKMYKHFEKNTRSRMKIGGWFWSASVSRDKTVIREVIKSSGGVKFSILQSDDPAVQENIDSFQEWIMEQIAKDLLVLDTAPPKFPPAKAEKPGGGWFGGGHSVSIRDVKQDILVRKKYSAEVRRTVTRHSTGGALIGIGTYKDNIRKELVFDVPKGTWDKVFYTMPTVTADPSVGIKSVELEIGIKVDGKEKQKDAAKYDPELGSWFYGNDYVGMMSWGLKGLMAANPEEDLKIHTKMSVTARNPYSSGVDKRIFESDIPVFDGKSFVAMPTDSMYAYMIYADSLSFEVNDDESNLTAVSVTLSIKDAAKKVKKVRIMIKPTNKDPYAEPIGILVPEDAKEVKADIKFIRKGSSPVNWSENGKNLIDSEYDGWLFLDDSMWQD